MPIDEAHRFGILATDGDGRVTEFVEKPADPPSNLVSMGVYVFSWPLLRELLSAERLDFGRDILPWMVEEGRSVYAYEFGGYWQDVGTVESYWADEPRPARRRPGHRAQRPRLADLHQERGAATGPDRSGRES